jgi:hypothetical protein
LRCADAAQVGSDVGILVFDGPSECSLANPAIPRSDVSFRLDQKTANFKVAVASRPMQWSPATEEKQKNELHKKSFAS